MTTPRANLPELSTAQASKETTINEAFAKLEALTVGGVIDRTLTTPPISPSDGDIYIVAASATGDWAGQDDNLAHYLNSSWRFYPPANGWHLFSIPDANFVWFNGTTWNLV